MSADLRCSEATTTFVVGSLLESITRPVPPPLFSSDRHISMHSNNQLQRFSQLVDIIITSHRETGTSSTVKLFR